MSKGPIYKWKGKRLVRVELTHATFGSIIRGRHLDLAKVKQAKEKVISYDKNGAKTDP